MLRSKSYCINIKPIPWQRPMLNGYRFFDGQHKDKVCFGIHMQQQHGEAQLFNRPIHLDMTFYMETPKSISARKKGVFHTNRPDLDNLCKFILDAMKDVLISDDKIICKLSAQKIYGKEPRVEFTITEVE